MEHAVILAHPNPASVNAVLAGAYADTVRSLGHQVVVRDLYAIGFDPCLHADELPWAPGFAPRPDVVAERALLANARVIAFVYPFWFNAPPAMLKGYVDRVFGEGFGFGPAAGGTSPLLTGRSLISISTSGAPDHWVARTSALTDLRRGFDDHVSAVCGLTVLEHVHVGGVTPGIRPDAVEAMAARVADSARKHFAPA
ncbi:NAD(P)H-dependent oxidoreductase [Caulobacter sp. KR2-114]|uniref:NAD(P)H-dependent oxidoreductase n=1 Tax=Caulobacter sp. KR2-114 TaxID=3400912 RepID=UPI003C00FF41